MMRYAALTLILVLILGACQSTELSREEEPAPVKEKPLTGPEASMPLRTAQAFTLSELHEPVYKQVDLRKLKVGMTKAEVLAIFPNPNTIDIRDTGYEMWQYNVAELYFKNGLLHNWFNL